MCEPQHAVNNKQKQISRIEKLKMGDDLILKH